MNWIELINKSIYSEVSKHKHPPEEQADLFKTFDGGGTEIEVLNFIHNLILVLKPKLVLETGSLYGYGSIALGGAIKENGIGKLITLEKDNKKYVIAKENICKCNLDKYIEILNINSLQYADNLASNISFDLVFFDSSTLVRIVESYKLQEKKALGDLIIFHDTSRIREKTFKANCQDEYVKKLDIIEEKYCKGNIEFYLSRGFRLMRVKKENNE